MSKKNTIVVAGANGFMGSRLLADALMHDLNVIALARANNGQYAAQRILSELEDHLTADDFLKVKHRLKIYSYDIYKPDLGLSSKIRDQINGSIGAVFNFVGDTNFFPKNIKQSFATNVDGPTHIIQTLCRGKAIYNHVSTAYVSGTREGVIYEAELDMGQDFKNDYEKSKFYGEKKVREICAENSIPFNIFRPSIVIRKNSFQKKTPRLNHFYTVVGLAHKIRLHEEKKRRCSKKDKLHIPIRVLGVKDSTLNFVDLDYTVQAMLQIVRTQIALSVPNGNKTYHLVNPNPLSNQEFIDILMNLYNFEGVEYVEDENDLTNMSSHEKLVKRAMANYIDYCYVNAVFDDTNTRHDLSGTGIRCPDFDIAYIARATGHFA